MNKTKMTTQSKLILSGLILSTLFIILVAILSTQKIQMGLNKGYENFGKLISATLAVDTAEIVQNIQEKDDILSVLKNHSAKIIQNNSDISFIEYFDNSGNVIYSTKQDYKNPPDTETFTINSPINIENFNEASLGSVSVGLSDSIVLRITNMIKNSIILVFMIIWLVFAFVILINSYLTTRELRILKTGVKRISTGEFGHRIKAKDVSPEIKTLFESFNDMSRRLHIYEQQNIEQLTFEKNKLEAILMNIANGVIVCDDEDNITLMNYQAQRLLKVNEAETLNQKFQNYYDENEKCCFKDTIKEYRNKKDSEPYSSEVQVNEKVLKTLISPMKHGYIVVLIDMTKEAEVEKIRGQFISNVSHELRTPVTVLRTYIDTLYNYGDEFDFDTQKEFIGTINDEIIRLQNLVNDILDFSRLDSNVKLEKEYSNVKQMVESCVKSVEILAKDRNITISISQQEDLPNVYMNEDSIFRALKNLLSNAIKYSPENDTIEVKTETSQKAGYIQISVKDNGVGISPENQSKIFDRFFRVENDTHTIKGTGLGLHIVKVSIEKHHHGEVFVNSTPGKGSTFGFIIPVNPIEDEVMV